MPFETFVQVIPKSKVKVTWAGHVPGQSWKKREHGKKKEKGYIWRVYRGQLVCVSVHLSVSLQLFCLCLMSATSNLYLYYSSLNFHRVIAL